MELKVGDRVILIGDTAGGDEDVIPKGTFGTVCKVCKGIGYNYGVEWDIDFPGGHDCDGLAEDGHGWFIYESEIAPVPQEDESDVDISNLL